VNIPEGELKIEPSEKGPIYVYHRDKPVAIVVVKTTINVGEYPEKCLEEARKKLKHYFESEEWRDKFKTVQLGIPIAIYLKDLDEIIRTNFASGVEKTIGDVVQNPNYKP